MSAQGSGIGIQRIPSPNFNDRKPGISLDYIVLHYTGNQKNGEEWIAAVCDPKVELSAHYLVREDGSVVQLVDESKRAWHAGKSFWRGVTDMNSASIGIELANPGHPYGYLPFPRAQIDALKDLLRGIIHRHNLDPRLCLVAHSDIAPTRKQDPGELFPWRELAQEGLGLWPSVTHQSTRTITTQEAVHLLRSIGYFCPTEDLTDPEMRAALIAFQRRFVQCMLSGELDAPTIDALVELALELCA